MHFDIEPDTLDAAVPNLLLQPLVENAIRHGIAPKMGGGRVDISARREDGDLCLVVRDNGVGLADKTRFRNGVGLTNTRSRLEHLFGDRYRFEFHAPPGGGLAVTVVIPFTRRPGQSLSLGPDRTDMESVA